MYKERGRSVRIKTSLIFLANSTAKLQHFPKTAKLFFLSAKVLENLTFCISTNGTKSPSKLRAMPLQMFKPLTFSTFAITALCCLSFPANH